ncbi:DUF4142 domain-containing protein [Nonomuraea sp. NN258]|uniref:DUF4142 domain-containing protein n=1 Tax=Nonomuraea antri TaxID=2730852 RepID=UPI0015687025|nr:DUF4142 domain-containing protein [Nonomuraea antri]NRQ37622.1 DUF4142 domain-containing protein [Nonomuraea antri]
MSTARKLVPAGVAAVLAFTVPATAQAQPTSPGSTPMIAQAEASALVNAQDRAYLRQAHRGHLAEIAAGKAALGKSRDRGVRAVAWRLVRDHRHLDARLRAVADRLHVSLPKAPSGVQRERLEAVLAKSGNRFDRAWLRLQIDAHTQSLQLGKRELRHGDSRSVKRLAHDSASAVRHHLHRVRAELAEEH